MTTKPAQSDAPSAAEFWTRQYTDDDFLQYEIDDGQRESVYKFAEAYAALGTARQDEVCGELRYQLSEAKEATAVWFARSQELLKRAETAESALSEARERAIQECAAHLEKYSEEATQHPAEFRKAYRDAAAIVERLAGASGAVGKGEDNG